MKYLVCWKRFIVENGIQKKLENAKEAVVEFRRRINAEIRKKKENSKKWKFRKVMKSKIESEWLRDVQNVETLYNEFNNVDFLE